jgi:hypothetical protein
MTGNGFSGLYIFPLYIFLLQGHKVCQKRCADVWPTDISPADTTVHRQTFDRQDLSPTDIYSRQDIWPTKHLADRTFGRQDIRPTGHLVDRRIHRHFWIIWKQRLEIIFIVTFTHVQWHVYSLKSRRCLNPNRSQSLWNLNSTFGKFSSMGRRKIQQKLESCSNKSLLLTCFYI